MQVTIHPSSVKGSLVAPASKSVMQRACAAALLHGGVVILNNYGRSDDDRAALQIIQDLGAEVTYSDSRSLKIVAPGITAINSGDRTINCGESGLAARMFTPIAALLTSAVTIKGSGSLANRPFSFFDTVLPALGVSVASTQGKLPLVIKGPLQPETITVDGSLSSQFLTGLLFAYAAAHADNVTIHCTGLNSKPYIDLTLQIMADFGMNIPVNNGYQSFVFHKKESSAAKKAPFTYVVAADWSSASFLMVAGAIAGNITLTGLDVFSSQADKKILEALQDCGCRLSIQMERIEVGYHSLRPFHFDATDCPDLFPPLVALAAYCAGTSVIEGVHRLLYKESNRALTLQQEFAKLGVAITIQDDNMLIAGGGVLQGANVSSRHDHRIAMACAVAALGASGPVVIDDAEAVNKSYPAFFEDLRSVCS